MYRKFKPLNIPDGWEQYWSKYPNGYSILEALIDWVSQVDDMVENQNEINETVETYGNRLDEFIGQYDTHLQETLEQTLSDWQNSGFLNVVINAALQGQLDEYITTNEQDKLSLSTQLAQKVGGQRKLQPEDFSASSLALVTGNGTVSVLSIPQPQSVTPNTTTFIRLSSNLFNSNDIVRWKVIDETGSITDHATYGYSHKIEGTPETTISVRGVNSIAFYDKQDVFKTRVDVTFPEGSTTFPADCHIARINFNSTSQYFPNQIQVNLGSDLLPYEPYYEKMEGVTVDGKDISTGSVGSLAIADNAISTKKVTFIKNSTNLFNSNDIVRGKVIGVTGSIADNATYGYSHKIEGTPGTTISTRGVNSIAFYDEQEVFKQRVDVTFPDGSTTFPVGCYIARVNFPTTSQYFPYQIQANLGDELLPYETFYEMLDGVRSYNGQSLSEFKAFDEFVVTGKMDGTYTSPTLDGYPDMNSLLPEQIYNWFDDLVSDFPTYVKKNVFGKDASGTYDINYYEFIPEDVPVVSHTVKRPKMILVAGIHGYERTHPYILFQAMKQICENWQSSEELETLRWNVHLIVVPVANPHSFPDGERYNANGVDIARNFADGWEQSEDVKGTSPLSEVEAQYIDNIMKENRHETILFTSLHNFTTPVATPEQFIWYPAANKLQLHIGKELLSKLSRKWKKEREWLPQDNTFFGYVDREAPLGSEGRHATTYGINGGTFEVSRIFRLEPDPTTFSSTVITLGTETLINFLLINLKHGVDYYNNRHRIVEK